MELAQRSQVPIPAVPLSAREICREPFDPRRDLPLPEPAEGGDVRADGRVEIRLWSGPVCGERPWVQSAHPAMLAARPSYSPPFEMRKDVREFIRRLEAVGLTVESTPGHYRVLRDGKPLRKANGMPFTLPFSPDTTRWRRAAIVELRKLGIDL